MRKDAQLVLFKGIMANSVRDFWINALKGKPAIEHSHYRVDEIFKTPNKPGIYAWYLSVDQKNFKDYFKLFKQKKVTVSLKGALSEEYTGEAKHIYSKKTFLKHSSPDFELCTLASFAFCPPLYIGISSDLNQRLDEHYSELQKVYFGKKVLAPPKLGKTDFDTIVESAHFAERIGHTLRGLPDIDLTALLIKTIEMPTSYSKTDLQKVEYYLNRTFIPIYGRK